MMLREKHSSTVSVLAVFPPGITHYCLFIIPNRCYFMYNSVLYQAILPPCVQTIRYKNTLSFMEIF